MGSNFSAISDSQFGWWGGEFERERGSVSSAPPTGPSRAHSFPSAGFIDDHDAKRRRSDQPPSARDSEETARLRWQAQNRNASYPISASISAAGSGLRSLIHPPHSSSMSRGSLSAAPGIGGASFDDGQMRPPAPPRSASIIGGQLAKSFADLSAADRARGSISRSPSMAPPAIPQSDRRTSLFPSGPLTSSAPLEGRSLPSPIPDGIRHTPTPHEPDFTRKAVTRPSSPERTLARRSSLTEMIMAQSGDAMGAPRGVAHRLTAADMDKPSLSEPGLPWSRRESGDSASGVYLNSDTESLSGTVSGRGRKRSGQGLGDEHPEDGMRGMEVLAESAQRAADDDGLDERDSSPGRSGGPKYTCSFCAKTFSRPSSLRIHTYSREFSLIEQTLEEYHTNP